MDTSSESDGEDLSQVIHTAAISPNNVCDRRSVHHKYLAAYLLLGSVLFEQIALYSLTISIKFTLRSNETMGWSSDHSETASLTFFGIQYLGTFVFAAFSDSRLGRIKTITIGFIFYLIGTLFMLLFTKDWTSSRHSNSYLASSVFDELYSTMVFLILICAALGAATIHCNLAVFSAEQIRDLKSISQHADKFQIALNIGEIISIISIPWARNDPTYYKTIYITVAIVIIISALLFAIACRYSIYVAPYDTVLTNCIPVCINAYQSKRDYRRRQHAHDESIEINEKPSSFLDYAKLIHHGKFQDRFVNDVKALVQTITVFGTLIPYWILYDQIHTTFIQQAKKMSPRLENDYYTSIPLVTPITIILGVIAFEMVSYKYFDSWKKEVLLVTKCSIGMCCAVISMIIAGIVEISRQNSCSNNTGNASQLSIFAQIPQYGFIGFSEAFTVVATFEYAYYTAPRSAQSLFMSLRFTAVGVAHFINLGFSNTFLQLTDQISNCQSFGNAQPSRYYTYFFLLAGFQCVFIIIFLICHKKYHIIRLNPEQIKSISGNQLPTSVTFKIKS